MSVADNIDLDKKAGFGNLSVLGEESEDEGREDEIKELLAQAFSNETFDDEEEEHSRIEEVDVTDASGSANSEQLRRAIETPQRLGETMIHRTHCPGFTGDTNGNYDQAPWRNDSHGAESLDELRTLSEFRERQLQRAEERIEILSKEKRSLAHQIGLLRAETLGMKTAENELHKSLEEKDGEIQFMKEKLNEVLQEYDGAKQRENEANEQNFRLKSEVGKLTQEVKLLSAIGLSSKEAEFNDALRDTRQKHAAELDAMRGEILQMKSNDVELRKALKQRDEQLEYAKEKLGEADRGSEALRKRETEANNRNVQLESQLAQLTQQIQVLTTNTNEPSTKESELTEALRQTQQQHGAEINYWKQQVSELQKNLEAKNQQQIQQQAAPVELNEALKQAQQQYGAETNYWKQQALDLQKHLEAKIQEQQIQQAAPVAPLERVPPVTHSIEIQTEETMETYRILGTLIESWVKEVTEANERADRAEDDAEEMEKALKVLQRKFVALKKVVILCRKEWRNREEILIQKYNSTKERFLKVLSTLASKFQDFEEELSKENEEAT